MSLPAQATPPSRRTFLAETGAALAAGVLGGRACRADAKRPPRLLLRSSWQTVNIGDIGHTPGVLRLLGEHLPEVEVTLWPANIGDGVEAMLRRHFPRLRIARGDAVREAFGRCDFLLHGSGPSLVAQKQVAQWRRATGKPYGVLGITLGSLDDEARALLDGARFVYFRDTVSLRFARAQGLKCPVLEFGPDAAFAVDLRDEDAAGAFLRKHELADGKFLCVIPRLRNTPYWKIHNRPMTDEDRRKDAENERLKEQDHAPVRAALVAFVRRTGLKVLLCPEDKSHMAVGQEMLLDRLPTDVRPRVVWRQDYWLTDEAVSVYARALALLSMDMHSPIMAVGNGTPAVHCRFRQQTSKGQMWADVGLGDWLFDLDVEKDGRRLTEAVLAIAADPAAARAKVTRAREFVRERHRRALKVLRENLHA